MEDSFATPTFWILLNDFEWASKSRLLEGMHDVTWCYMIPTVENKWNNHNYSECATQGNMDNCLSDSSISISAIAFSWSWTALMHKIVAWKGLKRWLLHCSPDIPWHPLTIASSGSGFAVEGASVDGASCWHHGNCLCHTYLLNGHPSQDCWKVRMMMHDDAWYSQ